MTTPLEMPMESPLSVFESASVVRMRPSDVLLFRCRQPLSDLQRAGATAVLNKVFPWNETLILDDGQEIVVLRPESGFIDRIRAFFKMRR